MGDLSAEYGPKCALPAKFLVFGIQVVMTTPFKNFDGSNFLGQVHGRHLGFQNGRHQGPIFLNISKTKTATELILAARPPFAGSMSHVD